MPGSSESARPRVVVTLPTFTDSDAAALIATFLMSRGLKKTLLSLREERHLLEREGSAARGSAGYDEALRTRTQLLFLQLDSERERESDGKYSNKEQREREPESKALEARDQSIGGTQLFEDHRHHKSPAVGGRQETSDGAANRTAQPDGAASAPRTTVARSTKALRSPKAPVAAAPVSRSTADEAKNVGIEDGVGTQGVNSSELGKAILNKFRQRKYYIWLL